MTGTVSDVAVADAKKGLTIGDVVNQIGQNKIAINFIWTLITGFLVMFMQAGFAIVETGLCRAKNANHTMMMNFMVYGVGMLAYWLIGFSIQMGGVGGVGNLGGAPPLNTEHTITLFGKTFGLFGQHGLFLTQGGTYDVAVMVIFLFQMVFMDTALTIVTGSAAERWKYRGVSWSRRSCWARSSIRSSATGPGAAVGSPRWGPTSASERAIATSPDPAWCTRSGGLQPWRWPLSSGRGSANTTAMASRMRSSDTISCSSSPAALSWRSGGSDSTPDPHLGLPVMATCASVRSRSIPCWLEWRAVSAPCSTCGCATESPTLPCPATVCWPAWSPSRRPAGSSTPLARCIIGLIAGVLVCLSVEFVDRVMKVDDPVGAISVHGANGLWGVISVGLFADGKSNYGGSWNGVTGSVTGLFYGDPSQLVAQLIGVSTLLGVVFVMSFVVNLAIDAVVGQRVSAKAELEGLDLPEMGQLGYPEFELKARSVGAQ